jgi:nitrogenase molybdenum-cofactor synthesis protein NifE
MREGAERSEMAGSSAFEERPCGRSRVVRVPGVRSRGCAYRGARLALLPIADAAHLVHGPITCAGLSWDFRPTHSSGPTLHRTTFLTDLGEVDLIHGGRERLTRAIEEVVRRIDPPAVFVYQTCLTAMIGEDLAAICQEARAAYGRPVVAVDAPGFAAGKDAGSAYAADLLVEEVVGTREPELSTPTDVDLIGEYNVAGETAAISALLSALGIRILANLSGDGRYRAIAAAHRARASIALCSKAVIGLAQKLEARWGIPWARCSFYGRVQVSESLRTITRLLVERGGPLDLPARAEALIAAEEARFQARVAPLRARLAGVRALVVTGGVKSWSIVSALQDGGVEVVGAAVHKADADEQRTARRLLGSAERLIDDVSSAALQRRIARAGAQVLLAGGPLRFAASRAGIPFVELNHERTRSYCGYEGAWALLTDVDRALANPVWAEARRPAPWDAGAAPGRAAEVA